MKAHRTRVIATLAYLAAIVAIVPVTSQAADSATEIWKDAAKSPDQRARDLLPRLTLEERIALVHADTTFTTPGVPRLGIPKLWMSDGPQGVREEIQPGTWNAANHSDDFATAMPADIALAATFDRDLAKAFGDVIGEEARTRGKNIMLCPGMNIMRTPLNGRNCEYLGEDPYLAGEMAVGFINGVQSHGVAACAKHFALNNQETQRGSVNVTVDERSMREIYLPAFQAAVTRGHVWSVMSAYNRVNGQYCSENQFLLMQVLKTDWNFQGLVMTDWGGCHSTIPAALNGLDLEMGSNVGGSHANDFFNTALLDAVHTGKVPMDRLDDMVLRNLRVMAATGNLDPASTTRTVPLMAPQHIESALKIAEAGCVLLKNDRDVLPIDATKVKKIAVIGSNAKAEFAHQGNSAQIKTRYETTPLQGITTRAGGNIEVSYSEGYRFTRSKGGKRGIGGAVTETGPEAAETNQQLISDAVAAAKDADVAIIVAGLYRSQDQEGADRADMSLPPGQADLIAAVTKANPRTVVILTGGSPSVVDPWIDDAAGLIMYWYGGTEGGNALAHLLFGDVSPSGHLPCSWPRQLSDSPAHAAADVNAYPGTLTKWHDNPSKLTPETGPQENYSEGILVGYRWYQARNIEPRFPFGFGLSYTHFDFSDLQISPDLAGSDTQPLVTVEATVTNIGAREGSAVLQVYVAQDYPKVMRPPQELKAFTKVHLKPGESAKLKMTLDRSAFAYFSTDQHCWIAEAGSYTIRAGDSANHLPLKSTFLLSKTLSFKDN